MVKIDSIVSLFEIIHKIMLSCINSKGSDEVYFAKKSIPPPPPKKVAILM